MENIVEKVKEKNIDDIFNTGEKIRIINRITSGKSSTILVLERIIGPKERKILINDVDVKNSDLDELRLELKIKENGKNLNSWIIQLIFFAGAIAKNILDEAISALNVETENNYIILRKYIS